MSGSRDQTVRLWNAFHGKILSVKQLPKRSSRKDKYDSYGPRDRLWLSVCWPVASPGHFISSSQGYVAHKLFLKQLFCEHLLDMYILLDVLLCSIAEYFYELCHILASP